MPLGGPTAELKCSRSLPYLPTHISFESGRLSQKSSLTKLLQWFGLNKKSDHGRKTRKKRILQIIQRILKKKDKKRKVRGSSEKFICVPSLYLYEKFPSGSSCLAVKNRLFRRTTSDSCLNYKTTYDQLQAKPECSYKVTLDGVQFNLDDLFVECSEEELSNLKKSKLRNFKQGRKMDIYEGSGTIKEPHQNVHNMQRAEENEQNKSDHDRSRKEKPPRNEDPTMQMVGDCLPEPEIYRAFYEKRNKDSYNLFQPLKGRKNPKQRSMLNPSDSSLNPPKTKKNEKLLWINDVGANHDRSIDQKELIRVTNSLKGTIRSAGAREVSSARNQPEASKFALNDASKYSKFCQTPSKPIAGDNDCVGDNDQGRGKSEKRTKLNGRKDRELPDDSPTCFELKKTTSQKTNLARMGSKLEISRLKKLKDFIRIHRIDYGKLEFKERLALQWVESKESRRPLQLDLSPKIRENRLFGPADVRPPPTSRFVPHFPPNRKFVYENRMVGCCPQESREQFVEPKVVGSFSEETLPFDSLFVPVPKARKDSVKIRSNLWRFQNKTESNTKGDREPPNFKSVG